MSSAYSENTLIEQPAIELLVGSEMDPEIRTVS
jgi:hypothetical protein